MQKQDTNEATQHDNQSENDKKGLYIVGIGASAGGLEAINAFFEHVEPDTNLCFVLVQHLSPDYKSMMPELLTKRTSLHIKRISEAAILEPNTIYTIPANKNITIRYGKIHLEEREDPGRLNLPINIFFKALALDQKEKAIGIVLSGTGSDATLGIESIKQFGGMVMVQDPKTAAFQSMPQNAISTGLVDFILPPAHMPRAIESYITHPFNIHPNEPTDHSVGKEIFSIISLLYKRCNIDFRQYKKATILRRIERRMSVNKLVDIKDYHTLINKTPDELEKLKNDLLIGVTTFFRDTKAFEKLDEKVLEPLVVENDGTREIRIWVTACSSGQEAYSIGMLLLDHCRKHNKRIPIKIFATDIDTRAIDKASKGIYPEALMETVPSDMLKRYFTHGEGKYQVKKELRDLTIFAKHDITKDPPFNNIDLVCCRNLLIYLEPELQEKTLSFLHFSLHENGFLFQGSSENLGSYSNVFAEVSKKYKIYRNKSTARIVDIHKIYNLDKRQGANTTTAVKEQAPETFSQARMISNFKEVILEDMVPPTMIINENNDLVHVAGEIDRYLKLPKKQLTLNVFKMVNEQLYVSLSNTISKAKNLNKKAISSTIAFEDDHSCLLRIACKPYQEPVSNLNHFIVSFLEIGSIVEEARELTPTSNTSKEKDVHIKRLEEELSETKEYLQSTIEELETSNEELQSSNEELMAANEELQSSNEELQSVNEELYTVNNEFQEKITEMTELNDDLNNFIQSTHIPTLFLDERLYIRRFTEEITDFIKIQKQDVGRYIGDFTHFFRSTNLISIAQHIFEQGKILEQEVLTQDDQSFLMRAMPYKTSKKEAKGVIFTFLDISDLKRIETQLVVKAGELERSNKELEQFTYVASHDLKAPITNLTTLLDLMEKQQTIQPGSEELFGQTKSTVKRLHNTVRTLNEIVTVKKDLNIKPEKTNFPGVLEDVLTLIQKQVEESNLDITSDFSRCENVIFPEVHLRSILQNMITNAIKYKKEGTNPQINIRSEKDDQWTILTVRDEGRGLNVQEYGKKIFGLFQRFHLDTEGKGIGLYIVKSIMENYGGKIEIDSEEGEGCTFRIYFP